MSLYESVFDRACTTQIWTGLKQEPRDACFVLQQVASVFWCVGSLQGQGRMLEAAFNAASMQNSIAAAAGAPASRPVPTYMDAPSSGVGAVGQ